jgi:hypothetical protein
MMTLSGRVPTTAFRLSFASARSAVSVSPIDPGVLFGVFMAVRAMSTTGKLRDDSVAVQQVGPLGHISKMSRVAAEAMKAVPASWARGLSVVTLMVHNPLGHPEGQDVGHSMGPCRMSARDFELSWLDGEGAVPIAVGRSDPGPTIVRITDIDLGPKALFQGECHGLSLTEQGVGKLQ